MKKIVLKIGGMSCSACSNGLEKYLNKQKGIIHASVNLVLAEAIIEYEDTLTLDDINSIIKQAGFKSLGKYEEAKQKETKTNHLTFICFSILSIFVLYISMSHMLNLPTIYYFNMEIFPKNYAIILFIFTIFYLVYGSDIFKNGFKNLIHFVPNMDTLVTIGVLSSFLYSTFGMIMVLLGHSSYIENLYFESSCMIIFFLKLGRYLDSRSKDKTKEAIEELVTITPDVALLKTETGEKEVTLDEVKKGNILLCKPGMKVAVDGKITKGSSYFDEAFITGESTPIKKEEGKMVIAGSLNTSGYIEYEALNIGKDSTISKIVALVVKATNTKTRLSTLADKVSSIFVPCIMVLSILTLVVSILFGASINDSFIRFVSVLVVACPCALGLATPLAIVVSEGVCAKNGIFVKSSEVLENVSKVDTVVFDKTGTITYGNLRVSDIYNFTSDDDSDRVMLLLSSLEDKSTHPISNAFKLEDKTKLLAVSNFQNIDGIGLSGIIDNKKYYVGSNRLFSLLSLENPYQKEEKILLESKNTILYLIEENKVLALVGVKDVVRKNMNDVIHELKKAGKSVMMLTGDNVITSKKVAEEVGINEVVAGVLPAEKTEKIKKLMNDGHTVMMVGDGINDAPSLATANIGVSVSSGTDIANNSSSIILMNSDLSSLVNLFTISKKTVLNIKENLFWAFFYNILTIPIAMGLLSRFSITINPMIAGFSMTLSSLTVVFNALRLRKIKLRRNDYV